MALDQSALPSIDAAKCDGCGKCVIACPAKALRVSDGKVQLVLTDCDYCGECEAACPTGAISCPYEIIYVEADSIASEEAR